MRRGDGGRRTSVAAVMAAIGALVLAPLPVSGAGPSDTAAERVSVIVSFDHRPGPPEARAIERLEGTVKHRYHLIDAIAADVPRGQLKRLGEQPGVRKVERDGSLRSFDHGPDTGDHEYENAWGVEHIGARAAHLAGIDGSGIKVAVIDTGIDYIHDDPDDVPYVVDPEFDRAYAGGYDFFNGDDDPFDDNGHGTHVAGILAADHNGYLVTGVAPGVELYALKILDANGEGEYSGLIAALQWVVDHNAANARDIQVVNMSLGGHEVSTALQAAISATAASGVLLAAASGNVNPLDWQELFYGCAVAYPAAYPEVLATTFTNGNDALTGYSCTGPEVDVAAPGDQIASTVPVGTCMFCSDTGYAFQSGTSMASPHLAGTLALLLDAGLSDAGSPGLLDDARAAICSTADDGFGVLSTPIPKTDPRYPKYFGCGVIDADGAVFSLTPPPPPPPNTPPVARDDTATVAEDGTVSIAVLANDSDADGDALAVASVGTAGHGTATANPDGTIGYAPAADYHGQDTVGYTISDGRGGTASATVSITVTPVNDPPVARDDTASTAYETPVAIAVLANDTDVDGDALSVVGVGPATHGTVTIGPGGAVTYTPAAGYSGPDAFTYTAGDGAGGTATATVSVTVGAAPPPTSPIHVGDLDRSASANRSRWTARVTISIHTATHGNRSGALVTGTWSTGEAASCTTGTNGRCAVTSPKLALSIGSVTFTVTSVTRTGDTYVPASNHDPDGDSDGTSITIAKPS